MASKLLLNEPYDQSKSEVSSMIDFIVAALVYLAIMFVVFFCISFVTVGLAYVTSRFIRHFASIVLPSHIALK